MCGGGELGCCPHPAPHLCPSPQHPLPNQAFSEMGKQMLSIVDEYRNVDTMTNLRRLQMTVTLAPDTTEQL